MAIRQRQQGQHVLKRNIGAMLDIVQKSLHNSNTAPQICNGNILVKHDLCKYARCAICVLYALYR